MNKNKMKHGQYGTHLYHVWEKMKQRCNNPKHIQYADYGGRGIKVCSEWNDFKRFYEWAISNGYKETLFIDRKDNNKGYSPENCHWVTKVENNNNKRNNRFFQYEGKRQTIAQWAREFNMNYFTLRARLCISGMPIEAALSKTTTRRKVV